VLPLLPAIAASSPIVEGRASGLLDARLEAYRTMSARTPRVTGSVIPETIRSRAEYETRVLAPMYDEIAPCDPTGILRHEWLNSRGAIPRFERGAIEIRLLDVQECPRADVAIAAAVVAVVRALYDERFAPLAQQQAIATESLHRTLLATIRDADEALVHDTPYLRALGIDATRCRAGDAWRARRIAGVTLSGDAQKIIWNTKGPHRLPARGWRRTLLALRRPGQGLPGI